MNDGLYTYISDIIIVSANPIVDKALLNMQEHYELLCFQLLIDLPVLCVPAKLNSAFATVYPGIMLVPESAWCDMDVADQAVLMNEIFIEEYLGKSNIEVTTADLLTIFELLTDANKLIEFADAHGLIIGGFYNARICTHETNSGSSCA